MEHISIITICFNNLEDLIKTCESVDGQSVKPDQHLIVNGSTNGEIADWITTTSQPGYRKWINERDRGIADAFNKGIRSVDRNHITHLLNSGDCYASGDILETVKDVFQGNSTIAWLSGKIRLRRGEQNVIVGKAFEKRKLYRGMRSVLHPTFFVRKEVYDRVGEFDDTYLIAMDYDMLCRMADEKYFFLDKLLVEFDDTGISTNNYIASLKETRRAYESHFGFSFQLLIWQLRLRLLHALLQTSFGKKLYRIKTTAKLENW